MFERRTRENEADDFESPGARLRRVQRIVKWQFAVYLNIHHHPNLARISHNPIERSSLFWYNFCIQKELNRRQGAVL
jgi:hypothetical protein